MKTPQPTPHNLLELYRAHHDEIDALTDPTTFFILGFINHVGKITLDELTRDVKLSVSELRVKLVPLLRGKLIQDAKGTLVVTPLGVQLLGELGFPTQVAPTNNQARGATRPAPSPSARGFNWSVLIGLAATAVLLLVVGGGTLLIVLTPTATPTVTPTLVPTQTTIPTSTPTPNTLSPVIPSTTPTASSTPSPARTTTPTITPSRTPTPTRTPTVTRTLTPVTLNLNPVEDAFVTSVCSPSAPHNTDRLNVASNFGDPDCWNARQRTLMRFDLKIPARAVILQAKLSAHVMYAWQGTTRIGVHRVTGAWSETTVTWNNQPGRTAMYNNESVGGEGWYTWELSQLVEEWHTGAQPNFGLVLVNTNENVDTINYRSFNSNEHVNRALRPYVQITYQPK